MLIEIVEDHLGLLAALQLEDNAHPVAVALVADIGDAFDALLVHRRRSLLDQLRLVHLVGNLGDDDLFLVLAHPLDGRAGAQLELPAAPAVSVDDPLPPQYEAARGEVRPRNHFQNLRERRGGALDQVNRRVDDFGEVVRGDVGRHAHGDARGAVHQQVGDARGQDLGLRFAVVVVRPEVHRLFVYVLQQRGGDAREPGLGVAHGRRRVAVDRPEVSLPFHQRIAHAERLRHAHQGIVDRGIAVGMVLAHHFAGDFGALARGPVGREAHLVHPVKDAPVHRLEAVAHVRQRAPHDHAHGVIQVRAAHFVFDVDGNLVLRAAVSAARSGQRKLAAGGRRRRALRWLLLIGQSASSFWG